MGHYDRDVPLVDDKSDKFIYGFFAACVMSIFVGFFSCVASYGAGRDWGRAEADVDWKAAAVMHGYAHYDIVTGAWKWNDKK